MVKIIDEKAPAGFERLVYAEDEASGLKAFIAIHSTALGPAAGGCRMWNYATEDEARADALRLARGMTYKNAMADLALGGGKSVIWGDAKTDKSPALFHAFGKAVDSLAGQYYTAEDVGISTEDMALVAEVTPYAVGLSGKSGDPSPFTAEGVFQCLKVGAAQVFGSDDLTGRSVSVQGLGHVGMSLAEKLHAAGAKLIVSDIRQDALDHAVSAFGATVCAPEEAASQDVDIYAPCALGGALNEATVPALKAKLVCGAANNQLATPEMADALRARGILYCPDYVVNSGGIISVAGEIHGRGENFRNERLSGVAERMRVLLKRAQAEDRTTTSIANEMVETMIAEKRVA
ncbi:Glu/Leu/Phe/Val dehydrogenase dimerization domain-containing protein [Paracoccaceae bacterium GXU_MW_L88]